MDWKPLLDRTPPYTGGLRGAEAFARRAADARARFRVGLDAVRRLEQATVPAPPERPPGLGDVIAAAFGPGDVATAWRRWRAARTERPTSALAHLEQSVEQAQREVCRLAASLDALDREEARIREELEALRKCVRESADDASVATCAARELRSALDAIALAQAKALPTQGAALEADAAVLEARLQQREDEARRFDVGAARLRELVDVGADAIAGCRRLRESLARAHADGEAALQALDGALGRLAAEAGAADLAESLADGMDALGDAVRRVHVSARADADRVLERIDRLAEAADLLAPADPARRAAEAEIDALARRA